MKYRITNLPLPVSDSAVRAIAEQQKIVLTCGPSIGSNWVEIETEEAVKSIPGLQAAIQHAVADSIGRVEELK